MILNIPPFESSRHSVHVLISVMFLIQDAGGDAIADFSVAV